MAALRSGSATVAAAGTAVALSTTSLFAHSISIIARRGGGAANVGNVFIGDLDVDNTAPDILPGEVVSQTSPLANGDSVPFDIADIFVDADNTSDGVSYWYNPA